MRPEERYARDVLSGKIEACETIQQACQRHLDDLEHGHERGLWFDADAADEGIAFFPDALRHWKGEWGPSVEFPQGQPFVLSDFQQFKAGSIFGWKRHDEDGNEVRRFREAIIFLPRKVGKSPFASGCAVKITFFEGEPGAEGYFCATKERQAQVCHEYAERFVKGSPYLRDLLRIRVNVISDPETASKLRPVGSDSDKQDGLSPAIAVIDELHAHRHAGIYDVMDSATGARREALILIISTAGVYRPESIGFLRYRYGKRILDGTIEDDRTFVFIAELEADRDWKDEANWARCTPNLGVSVKIDDLRAKRDKALAEPSRQGEFRRKHMNQWVGQEGAWIDTLGGMDAWNALRVASEELSGMIGGRRGAAGIDLARRSDIASVMLYFPGEDGERHAVRGYYWIPEADLAERSSRGDGVDYEGWVERGLMEVTPGNAIDTSYIRQRVNEIREELTAAGGDLPVIAYDPRFSHQLVIDLQTDGFEAVEVPQTYPQLHEPFEELGRQVMTQELAHDGDLVLRWMVANVVVKENAEGLVKPDKARSGDKIDGVDGLILAIKAAMFNMPGEEYGSVYETRGVLRV